MLVDANVQTLPKTARSAAVIQKMTIAGPVSAAVTIARQLPMVSPSPFRTPISILHRSTPTPTPTPTLTLKHPPHQVCNVTEGLFVLIIQMGGINALSTTQILVGIQDFQMDRPVIQIVTAVVLSVAAAPVQVGQTDSSAMAGTYAKRILMDGTNAFLTLVMVMIRHNRLTTL